MSFSWNCFQCQSPNFMSAKHCSVCGAQRPPVAEALETMEAGPAVENLVNAVTDDTQPQSDMLAGLAALVKSAADGDIKVGIFIQQLRSIRKNLDKAFGDIYRSLDQVSEAEDTEYVQAVQAGLQDSAALFRLALTYLERFGERQDLAKLRVGMMVAEKAEECYNAVMGGLQEDAAGGNLAGHQDIIRSLANQVVSGALSLEDYVSRLEEVDTAVHIWLKSGTERLEAGLAAAKLFDGKKVGNLGKAGELLDLASQDLGHVILAIHNSQAVEAAVDKLRHSEDQ